MYYLGAVKRLISDPLLYVTLSLLIFVPGANLAVIGYLVNLAGVDGPEAPFGNFRKRFVTGAQTVAVMVVYLMLPAVVYNFYSLQATLLTLLFMFPFLAHSLVRLGMGTCLEEVLELENLLRAYSPRFLVELFKAMLFTLLTFVVMLVVPLLGWIGILYGPLAIFMSLMGQAYQDHFV
ncbi:MAG TPA: hypothetical protein ENN60_00185 [archaeon]|nr:hypothetical protein [archaeon]